MTIDDPEYGPTYYTILAKDSTGYAAKCVRPPANSGGWNGGNRMRPAARESPRGTVATTTQTNPPPTTYPNNIPIGSGSTGNPSPKTCYGCGGQDGHMMGDCPEIRELLKEGIIKMDEGTRKITMADGTNVRRAFGEPIAPAVKRQGAPRVMLGLRDAEEYRLNEPVDTMFYDECFSGQIEEVEEIDEDPASAHEEDEGSEDGEEDITKGQVYLSFPKQRASKAGVHAAERTVPSMREARKQVFDGVHLPRRERPQKDKPVVPEEIKPKEPVKRIPQGDRVRDILADVRPYDARRPRIQENKLDAMDVDSPEGTEQINQQSRNSGEVNDRLDSKKAAGTNKKENLQPARHGQTGKFDNTEKGPGRRSEIDSTVNLPKIVDRILDLPVSMSVREVLAASKELRNGIQEVIKLKNVKAVLMGMPSNGHWNWPRSEGVLIRMEMDIAGRRTVAIVDTGSQLDVVRADVAALIVHRPVDMTRTTGMNDANGGRGQLRGFIHDVELNCGSVSTRTGLWVSQQAPFELLLGRPWQRNNLVTIDEREEGTYLVFKDRETRQPRYELMAVPHEATSE
ncbi:hypothetical protein R3P38DRAFT_2681368, partial [Favolaschia claudopus]